MATMKIYLTFENGKQEKGKEIAVLLNAPRQTEAQREELVQVFREILAWSHAGYGEGPASDGSARASIHFRANAIKLPPL